MPFTTPLRPENLRRLFAERLGDENLRGNLQRAMAHSLRKRLEVVSDFPDWEQMRETARSIKAHTIAHLSHYLEQFESQAIRAGAKVIFCRTAEEAGEETLRIVAQHGKKVMVKSKSMTTEEIHLNHVLERNGYEVLETDLGEYIVQLAGEIPSHITGPAVHKSREEIGRLFQEKLGIPYTCEPAELTAVARRILREHFLNADVGISGVNFGVAETGSICVVENEGNARLSVSLPKVHIAVMGLEKLVPDMRSLTHMLNMLARSATGQRISSYTSVITGPRRVAELDGPGELYILVLDNGRTDLLKDTRFREALQCIRCGACMNTCPVYQKVGGHGYGSIYPGPIGSVLTPVFQGLERAKAMPYASSLCGSCAEICPVKIDLHHMLLWHRHDAIARGLSPLLERLAMRAFAFVMLRPALYRWATAVAATFMPLLRDSAGSIRVPVWSRAREMQPLAQRTFNDLWKERHHERP
jgi:L-lactate dehydrogenase complex protein LldF